MHDWHTYVRQRLSLPGLRERRARDMVEEVAAQLEDVYADARSSGRTEAEAEAIARSHIQDWDALSDALTAASRSGRRGKADRWAETASDRLRKGGWLRRALSYLIQDVLHVGRQVRTRPGYSLSVTLTLALGIGASVLVFSVFDAVVLRPFPFEKPDELVRIWEVTPSGEPMAVSDPDFLDFRARGHSFQGMAATYVRPTGLSTDQESVRISGIYVTDGFFKLLKVVPSMGRLFLPEEYQAEGEPQVAIIGHEVWQTQLGADPAIIGKTVLIDGWPREVVGVLPAGMTTPFAFDVWLPFAADRDAPRAVRRLGVVGRMAPGISEETARKELTEIMASLGATYPESHGNWSVQVLTLADWIVGPDAQHMAHLLLGAASLLLLLACASVSNLMMARATVRGKETTVKVVMGADTRRLLSQFLVESLLLGGLGASLGVLLTYLALPVVRTLPASPLPRLDEVSMDGSVLLFAVGATVLSALVFGIAPAAHAIRHDFMDVLKVGTPNLTVGARRVRSGLLVAQITVAGVLLAGASLLADGFRKAASVDPGIDTRGLLLAEISPPGRKYPDGSPETVELYRRLSEAIEALPGVAAAGATTVSPLSDWRTVAHVTPDPPVSSRGNARNVGYRVVTPGFFRAMGIPVLKGEIPERWYLAAAATDPPEGKKFAQEVLISRSLAQELWGDADPVDRGIEVLRSERPSGRARVSGVVGDARDLSYPRDEEPQLYSMDPGEIWSLMTLAVRTRGDPEWMWEPIRETIRSIEPSIAVSRMRLGNDVLSTALARPRLAVLLMGIFSLTALALAAAGVSGLTAFVVARQTRDIGIRLALGASKGGVLGVILRQILVLAGVGTGLSLIGALVVTSAARSLFFGVEATPALAYGAAVAVLGAACIIATLVPAWRALSVDPARTLQAE